MINVNKIFDDFFQHDEKKVIVFKGKWGTGKTYYWKKYIKSKKDFTEKIISYVSLFGLENINEVKAMIFENAEFVNPDTYKDTIKSMAKKSYSLVRHLPKVKEFKNLASKIENSLIKNFIICLDDLERKSDKLRLSQILGLISVLKEESQCRFILIFNEYSLSEQDLKDLNIYREKVIDLEILYNPNISDNVKLIFTHHRFHILIEDLFNKLQIKNIRVMKQTQWNIDYFAKHMDDVEETLVERIISNVIYISCFHYHDQFNFDITTLKKLTEQEFLRSLDRENKSDVVSVTSFGYRYLEIDEFIIEYIRYGFINNNDFEVMLKDLNEKEVKYKISETLGEIWRIYNSNFIGTSDRFINKATEYLNEYSGGLSERDLNQICTFLQELDNSIDTTRWKDNFIKTNIEKFKFDDLNRIMSMTNDQNIIKYLTDKIDELKESKTIKSIVYYIVEHSGWNPTDLIFLDNYSEDDYLNWLRNESDQNLLIYLRDFLKTFNSNSAEKIYRSIGTKLENSIKILAKENKFNLIRAQNLFKMDI
ncbi:MAG: P-loop NTPase fold protein [Calditrichaceae bacterium]